MPINVSYGPPGHKGVTHLVAIGDTEDGVDAESHNVMLLSIAAIGLGLIANRPTVRNVGIGAATALLGVRWLRSRRTVEVTAPKSTTIQVPADKWW